MRVHRRDGWAWGDPQELLGEVLAALEEALVAAAVQADATEGDLVLPEPVRLTIGADGPGSISISPGGAELIDRLRQEVLRSRGGDAQPAAEEPSPTGTTPPAAPGPDPASATRLAEGLGHALGGWSRSGQLPDVVAAWPQAVRAAWVRALEVAGADPACASRSWATAAVASVAARLGVGQGPLTEAESRILVLAGALAAAAEDHLPDAGALAEVRRLVGADDPDPVSGAPPGPSPATVPTPPTPSADRRPPRGDARERDAPTVVPALPFLVVLQLQRLGYLAPAAAALGVSGLSGADALLAAMVAGKVLPAPAHGWQREGADRDVVAIVADQPATHIEEVLAGWAPVAAAAVPVLASVLVALYADDLDPDGLVLTRTGDDGWLCGEASGLPVSWGAGDAELATLLRQLGEAALAEDDLFAGLAAALAGRRGAPGLHVRGLERHLGAAVGAALGSLALELWGPGADALLALDRLADLEARVAVADEGVAVALPRGQRWLDLRRVGLLDAWTVPWAPGGRWELVTW